MWYCKDARVSVEPLCGTVKTPGCQQSHYVILSRHECVSSDTMLYCNDALVSVKPLCGSLTTRGCQ